MLLSTRRRIPPDVVGMALIDPGQARRRCALSAGESLRPRGRASAHLPWRAGSPRSASCACFCRGAEYDDLPKENQAADRAFNVTTKFFRTLSDQYDVLLQTYSQQREVADLGSTPLVVVSATLPDDATRRVWTQMNGELTKLSTRGAHRVVPGATHSQLLYKRQPAADNHRCHPAGGPGGRPVSLKGCPYSVTRALLPQGQGRRAHRNLSQAQIPWTCGRTSRAIVPAGSTGLPDYLRDTGPRLRFAAGASNELSRTLRGRPPVVSRPGYRSRADQWQSRPTRRRRSRSSHRATRVHHGCAPSIRS